MPGPGEYRPDPTEGIVRIEDLPKPKLSIRSRNYRRRPCPRCRHSAYRDRTARRSLHDLGDTLTGRPRDVGYCQELWMTELQAADFSSVI